MFCYTKNMLDETNLKEAKMREREEDVLEKDFRCECGKLCFKKTDEGYEFKCSRCKRVCIIKYEDLIVDYLNSRK